MGSSLLVFLRQSLRAFHHTGAVCPSSPFLARAIVRPVERTDRTKPLRVLEVGPGTGAFTQAILQRLRGEDRLDLVEINPDFAQHLREQVKGQPAGAPQVRVFESDIRTFSSDGSYDAAISGLPLNNFPPEMVEEIFGQLERLIRPGGELAFFEYLAIRRLKTLLAKPEETERLARVGSVIGRWKAKHGMGQAHVFANVPPAVVHYLRMDGRGTQGKA